MYGVRAQCNQKCTVIYGVRIQCDQKCTVIYEVRAQIDYVRTSKIAVDATASLQWSYPYTYLVCHIPFKIFILQRVVSKDFIMIINTRLVNYVTLYGLNIQYISCDYVVSYDVA